VDIYYWVCCVFGMVCKEDYNNDKATKGE
jgi:hypothetical protein